MKIPSPFPPQRLSVAHYFTLPFLLDLHPNHTHRDVRHKNAITSLFLMYGCYKDFVWTLSSIKEPDTRKLVIMIYDKDQVTRLTRTEDQFSSFAMNPPHVKSFFIATGPHWSSTSYSFAL